MTIWARRLRRWSVALVTRRAWSWRSCSGAGAGAIWHCCCCRSRFLALLAPEVLLLALPSLAINLLADFSPMHQVDTLIYAAPIVPFVMIAAVYGTCACRPAGSKIYRENAER